MSASSPSPAFLFSLDVEDVRAFVAGGERFRDAVVSNVERYLQFLERHSVRCTFFVVGDVARRYPQLVRDLVSQGHEIACHTSDHLTLDRQSPASFREDLLRNLDDLGRAGASDVCGFRAPVLSLTERTAWAYEVLAEIGFSYSSSVLPARSPLHGWPGFSPQATRARSGVWELPVSVSGWPGLNVPFAAGVYFRMLPFFLVRRLFHREMAAGRSVVGYFHPYDVDVQQEHFMHPELGGNHLLNWMMYRNRHLLLPRLDKLLGKGCAIVLYKSFVARLEGRSVAEEEPRGSEPG